MDIIWLQRDLGLYMVNLFDTFHAANALGFPTRSLAFLLKKYVNFDAAKQYQMADWRIRPLPQEMFEYARSDTHFLLYIFDHLRNELIDKGGMPNTDMSALEYVLKESRTTALKRYTRENYNEKTGRGTFGWDTFIKKNFLHLNLRQLAVLKALHSWRDRTARTEDESHHYIMPKHVLLSLTRGMPEEPSQIISTFGNKIPQIVRIQISDIVNLIKAAKASVTDAELQMAPGPKAQPAAQAQMDPAVSSVLFEQTASSNADLFTVLGKRSNLRSESTTFWGAALGSSKWDPEDKENPTKRLKFDVPLPPLNEKPFVSEPEYKTRITAPAVVEKSITSTAEDIIYFDDRDQPTETTTTETTAEITTDTKKEIYHEYTKSRAPKIASDDVIVVKEVGGGRNKRKHTKFPSALDEALKNQEEEHIKASESIHDMDMIPLFENGEPSNASLNPSRTQQKSKKQKRQERKDRAAGEEEKEEKAFEPFDYSKADSVLHSRKGDDGKKKKGEKKERKKTEKFDPFAKHGDAPKGMRKRQTEFEGRSATFKK